MLAILLALSLSQIKPRSASRYNTPKRQLPANLKDQSIFCNTCLDLVDMVDDLLQDDKLEEEIILKIDEYCQKLPTPYSSLCAAYTESAVPLAISYIKEGLDNLDICGKLHLCDPVMANKLSRKARRPHPSKPSNNIPQQVEYVPVSPIKLPLNDYDKNTGCEMCNAITNLVEQLLLEKTSESQINSLVLDHCGTYKSPYTSLCDTLAQQYLQYIIVWVEGKISHSDICAKVGICEN